MTAWPVVPEPANQRGQVPLSLGERVAVLALEEGGDGFVQRVLVIRRLERPRDRPSLGVADVLRHLVAEGALAEDREALPEGVEIAAGAGVLRAEGVDVTEKTLVD